MSDPSNANERPEYRAQLEAAVRQLLQSEFVVAKPHHLVLDALLSAYASKLLLHPCCMPNAVAGLRGLAETVDGLLRATAVTATAANEAPASASTPPSLH